MAFKLLTTTLKQDCAKNTYLNAICTNNVVILLNTAKSLNIQSTCIMNFKNSKFTCILSASQPASLL